MGRMKIEVLRCGCMDVVRGLSAQDAGRDKV